ncbi:MAG: helix-turn-helix transcriptional regulator [Ruminococcus sp.]|nr:helix-turn-helix transcriptional regulator [Candidatus Apopatosoma intestinale]
MGNDWKKNIADNIVRLRTTAGLTQAQFAEKLNYTDKAVSKWERAESIPDVLVLKQIADLFGTKIDDLLLAPSEFSLPEKDAETQAKKRNKLQISLLSAAGVWLIVIVAFAAFSLFDVPRAWLCFLWGVPATATDLLVFNAIWGQARRNFLFISLLIWSFAAALYVTLAVWGFWYLFLFALPLQAATVFWARMIKK